jgi:hypothetical protein
MSEKLDKGRELFNRHGFEDLEIDYNFDKARYECTNPDGFWVSYNGENWIQAVPVKSLPPNTGSHVKEADTPTLKVELSDEFKHNCLQKIWDEHLKEVQDEHLKERGFVKNDSGKLQWSLLPFEELEDVVKVLMLGAKEYTPDNWKKCDDVTRYKDALMRHVISYVSGDATDEESGLSHLAHAVCNCLFLMYFDNTKKEEK